MSMALIRRKRIPNFILIGRWERGEKSGEPITGEKKREGKKSEGKILLYTDRNFLSLPQKLEMFLKKKRKLEVSISICLGFIIPLARVETYA